MLDLTENATSVIRSIAEQPDGPVGGGLRITSDHTGSGQLIVSPAVNAEEGDEIVEKEGARVFLEPQAASLLGDQVLDAQVTGQGQVEFMLTAQ